MRCSGENSRQATGVWYWGQCDIRAARRAGVGLAGGEHVSVRVEGGED